MSSQQFNELPNSKNAVESYNRFGRSVHRQPLKVAMMATYREDMAKSFEIMARGRGLLKVMKVKHQQVVISVLNNKTVPGGKGYATQMM